MSPKEGETAGALQGVTYNEPGDNKKKGHTEITIPEKVSEVIAIGGPGFPLEGKMIE